MGAAEDGIALRPIRAEDAAAIIGMAREFGAYLKSLGDSWEPAFTEARYREDGFGENPAFFGFIAEKAEAALGYILLTRGYDVDLAIRQIMIVDLWVRPQARRVGLGRQMIERAAMAARAEGAKQLIWNVYRPNRPAYDFYRRIGARDVEDLDWMFLDIL